MWFKYVCAEIRLESYGGKEDFNFHQSLYGFEYMEYSMWVIYSFYMYLKLDIPCVKEQQEHPAKHLLLYSTEARFGMTWG